MKSQDIFNFISVITSLLAAVASLVISLIALKISRKVYLYSSKDYTPEFEYSIDDKDETLVITNKSKDLFNIKSINFLKIIITGFEDFENKGYVEIPFITRSVLYSWIDGCQEVVLKKDDTGACAYQICPYKSEIIEEVENKIRADYSMESKRGYALPSLKSVRYILEIDYGNNFQERKSVVFCKQHVHGMGYQSFRISHEETRSLIEWANLRKFDSFDELWSHITTKYFHNF